MKASTSSSYLQNLGEDLEDLNFGNLGTFGIFGTYMFAMIASANAEVLSSVAPSIWRARS